MRQGFAYRPELDGLRAIAVGSVILYHLNESWLPGGYLGVDLFFVLSGYLITSILIVERTRTGRLALAEFYARRSKRLLPAMMVMLITVAVYFGAVIPPLERTGLQRDLIATLVYLANWNFIAEGDSYFAQYVSLEPVRHTWSLAIEEQFYLLWPALMLIFGRTTARLAWSAGCGIIVSAVSLWMVYDPVDASSAYFSSITRVHEILVGVLTAVALQSGAASRIQRVITPFFPLIAATVIIFFFTLNDESERFYKGGSLIFSIAIAAIVIALPFWPKTTQILASKGFVAVGLISYGLYLWHWPIIVVARHHWGSTDKLLPAAAIVATTTAISIASYHLIERPIRRGTRLGFAEWRPARVIAMVPIATAIVIGIIIVAVNNPKTPEWVTQDQPAILDLAHERTDSQNTSTPLRVGVVGDSVAVSLLPGFREIAETGEIELLEAAIPACPIGYEPLFDESGVISPYAETCKSVLTAHDAMLAEAPDLIIWHDLQSVLARRNGDGTLLTPGSEAWSNDLVHSWEMVLNRFLDEGAEVIVLRPPLRSQDFEGCRESVRTQRCNTIQTQDKHIRAVTSAFASRITGRPRVTIVDLDPFVCPDGYPCPESMNGIELRITDNDQTHFTEAGARWLVNQIFVES